MTLPPLAASDLDEVLDQTRELWRELSGERIFITGGTGFFGVWLLESFAWANQRLSLGAHAVVLSRNPDAFVAKLPHLAQSPALSYVRGDASSFAFPAGTFAAVIHAATEAHPVPAERLATYDRDLAATRRTLDFALQARACRYLFTSSGAVYGKQPAELTHLPESYLGAPDPCDPGTGYGQAKRTSEFLCALYANQHPLQTKIARCFAFVGPHLPLDANFAIGNFLRDALAGGPIRIGGDGTQYRSYMYSSDLMVWLWTILFRGETARAYNVGSEDALSIAELAREVVTTVAQHAQVLCAQEAQLGRAAARYVPATSRARSELGLQARVPLQAALLRTVSWLRAGG